MIFRHPMQLYSLEHPDHWEVRYQEETGAVIFVHAGDEDASALSITPLAVTGAAPDLVSEVVRTAERFGVPLAPEAVESEERGETRFARAEGARTSEDSPASPLRFWAVRHQTLTLYGVQIGPGTEQEEQRAAVDAAMRSLEFPEILPPTPVQFRDRVLETLAREYPSVRAAPAGEWTIQLASPEGAPTGTVGLENLYRACLLNPEVTGAMIRDHLDQAIYERPEEDAFWDYGTIRERLLPVLKPEEWLREMPEGVELLAVQFAPGLRLCFAIDEPARLAYATREMLERWDIPLERVQEVAQDNLAAQTRDLEMVLLPGGDGRPIAVVVNSTDGYAAARLTVPAIRDAFAAQLGEEYLVGLPNRDFLVAFSERDPETKAAIAQQVRQDYYQMHHPITPTIYRVRGDLIEAVEL